MSGKQLWAKPDEKCVLVRHILTDARIAAARKLRRRNCQLTACEKQESPKCHNATAVVLLFFCS
jgi:hypothetical protein